MSVQSDASQAKVLLVDDHGQRVFIPLGIPALP